MALNFSGNDNIIEYNEIHNVVKETSDAGAVYAYSTKTGRGNIIRHNYIHSLTTNCFSKEGIHAIYVDGRRDGTTVESNIFENIRGSAFFINAGCDNIFKNNICIESDYMVHFAYSKYNKRNNLDLNWNNFIKDMDNNKKSLYISRYPKFAKYEDETIEYPLATRYNYVSDNAMLNVDCPIYEHKNDGNNDGIRYASQNVATDWWFTSLDTDKGQNVMNVPVKYSNSQSIGFTDYDNKNFTLTQNSDIYTKIPGFIEPQFNKIGINNGGK